MARGGILWNQPHREPQADCELALSNPFVTRATRKLADSLSAGSPLLGSCNQSVVPGAQSRPIAGLIRRPYHCLAPRLAVALPCPFPVYHKMVNQTGYTL